MRIPSRVVGGPGSTSEATLFQQAQAGCLDSLNRLMERHEGLVHAVVRRHGSGVLSFVDALHAGRLGLWRAILHYDPRRGLAFSTYAWPCILRQIWGAAQAQARFEFSGMTYWAVIPHAEVNPVAEQEIRTVRRALSQLIERLPERLRIVMVARYGLNGHPVTTYAEIGALLGLTKQRICQLHTEALVWLRQPAHSQMLRSLLELHTVADYQAADELAQRWLQRRGGRRAP
jgi:RNA polymerase sigma factor (sigma-70 family)